MIFSVVATLALSLSAIAAPTPQLPVPGLSALPIDLPLSGLEGLGLPGLPVKRSLVAAPVTVAAPVAVKNVHVARTTEVIEKKSLTYEFVSYNETIQKTYFEICPLFMLPLVLGLANVDRSPIKCRRNQSRPIDCSHSRHHCSTPGFDRWSQRLRWFGLWRDSARCNRHRCYHCYRACHSCSSDPWGALLTDSILFVAWLICVAGTIIRYLQGPCISRVRFNGRWRCLGWAWVSLEVAFNVPLFMGIAESWLLTSWHWSWAWSVDS